MRMIIYWHLIWEILVREYKRDSSSSLDCADNSALGTAQNRNWQLQFVTNGVFAEQGGVEEVNPGKLLVINTLTLS